MYVYTSIYQEIWIILLSLQYHVLGALMLINRITYIAICIYTCLHCFYICMLAAFVHVWLFLCACVFAGLVVYVCVCCFCVCASLFICVFVCVHFMWVCVCGSICAYEYRRSRNFHHEKIFSDHLQRQKLNWRNIFFDV